MKNNQSQENKKSVLLSLASYVHSTHMGVIRYAIEAGWQLESSPCFMHELPRNWSGDGIIADVRELESPLSRFIASFKKPVVSVRTDCLLTNVHRVIPDNVRAGREMARELLSLGLQNFAFYTVGSFAPVVQQRYHGFKNELEKSGNEVTLLDFTREMSDPGLSSGVVKLLAKALQKLPKPVGVASQFDYDSLCVSQSALLAGLKIPDEVAIIGIDNDPLMTDVGPVSLTSVDTNLELLGYRAAHMLDQLMNKKKFLPKLTHIPVGGVVRRRSTERYATSHPLILKLLDYIDQNYRQGIDVSDVVRLSEISRSGLFALFQNEIGISPKKLLLKKRLDYAKILLKDRSLQIRQIARECGFNTDSAFVEIFKKSTGCLPTDHRFSSANQKELKHEKKIKIKKRAKKARKK